MSRLFIAAYPPPEVVAAIEELPRPTMAGVRWVPVDQWHLTLRFLGEVDEGAATAALALLGDQPPAQVELGPFVSRLGRDVVCLPAQGLDPLARAVAAATGAIGEPADPRPFAGHLTLARLRNRGTCGLAGERFAASFEVRELSLVRSWLTPDGATHEVLAVHRLVG